MRKKILFQSVVAAGSLMLLLVGIYAFADWTAPVETPPFCTLGNPGCDASLHVGLMGQVKDGGLTIGANSGVVNGLLVLFGNVGIGTASPVSPLEVQAISSISEGQFRISNSPSNYTTFYQDTSGNLNISSTGGRAIIQKDIWVGSGITNQGNVIMIDGVDSSASFFDGIEVGVLNSALTANASKLRGGVFSASHWSDSFSVAELIGVSGEAHVANGGGVTNMYGGKFTASASAGNISNMYALHAWTWLDVPGFTLPNAYGIYSRVSKTPTTSVTNGYGLYIADIEASNDYALYAAGANDDSYFAGNVGIGTTSPNAKLQVSSGDVYVSTTGNGVILKATDGPNCYRLTVNNSGTPTLALVSCP